MEIGAGTGYWAATLRRRGVDVLAYDLNPPTAEAPEANAYHGRLPPFTDVLRGGPKARARGHHACALESISFTAASSLQCAAEVTDR